MATLQVREISDETIDALKEQAKARGQSLSAFVRELLDDVAGRPSIDAVMADIAASEPIYYTIEDLREAREDGRR